MGQGAGPKPTRLQQSQIFLGSRRHSRKEGCLKPQAINVTHPRRVKTWRNGSLRLEEIYHPTRMSDSLLNSLCTKEGLIKLFQLFPVRDLNRLFRTLLLIRQINLTISLQHIYTYIYVYIYI